MDNINGILCETYNIIPLETQIANRGDNSMTRYDFYNQFLLCTAFRIDDRAREVFLGIPTSLTDAEYTEIQEARQFAAEQKSALMKTLTEA
ncbi:MAG: hypothetical protein ACC608_09620 [Anaerofustis sp.]